MSFGVSMRCALASRTHQSCDRTFRSPNDSEGGERGGGGVEDFLVSLLELELLVDEAEVDSDGVAPVAQHFSQMHRPSTAGQLSALA